MLTEVTEHRPVLKQYRGQHGSVAFTLLPVEFNVCRGCMTGTGDVDRLNKLVR